MSQLQKSEENVSYVNQLKSSYKVSVSCLSKSRLIIPPKNSIENNMNISAQSKLYVGNSIIVLSLNFLFIYGGYLLPSGSLACIAGNRSLSNMALVDVFTQALVKT